jgi:TM2 domain-containing membrane protein YozV
MGGQTPTGGMTPDTGGQNKSPGLAFILSIIITGVGQIYVGKVARGLAFLFGGILFGIVVGRLGTSGVFLALLVPIVSGIDAYFQAKNGYFS